MRSCRIKSHQEDSRVSALGTTKRTRPLSVSSFTFTSSSFSFFKVVSGMVDPMLSPVGAAEPSSPFFADDVFALGAVFVYPRYMHGQHAPYLKRLRGSIEQTPFRPWASPRLRHHHRRRSSDGVRKALNISRNAHTGSCLMYWLAA